MFRFHFYKIMFLVEIVACLDPANIKSISHLQLQ